MVKTSNITFKETRSSHVALCGQKSRQPHGEFNSPLLQPIEKPTIETKPTNEESSFVGFVLTPVRASYRLLAPTRTGFWAH